MANGIQATVTGNLTADPELKFGDSGNAMLTFSVASERSWKNDKGEWENETSYVDVVAWRYLAEDAARTLEKGLRVTVTGRFEQRSWEDKDTGQKRYKWQLVADEVAVSVKVLESIERRRKPDQAGNGQSVQSRRPAPARPAQRQPVAAAAADVDGW